MSPDIPDSDMSDQSSSVTVTQVTDQFSGVLNPQQKMFQKYYPISSGLTPDYVTNSYVES